MLPGERYFSALIPELQQRSALGAISRLALSNPPLRQYLAGRLAAEAAAQEALLADPVFEATFGWARSRQSMRELAGGLLSSRFVQVLAHPPTDKIGEDYSFPETRRPYVHQVEAWEQLSRPAPQAVVVTSGTGSGKTECFLVPILDELTRQAEKAGPLTGVQALFLYPLNALINSQKDRLRAWTDALQGAVRFCLYNGLTPRTATAARKREWPSEVADRVTLRESPPPILVTNATMLEYMLVRSEDAPIIQQSQGTLRWIVLDEAHTYIGSQAAEVALLLRRVMVAFGVRPDGVKFVATSATIGQEDEESVRQLQSFISSLSGVGPEQVTVIAGRRAVPRIEAAASSREPSLKELQRVLTEEGREALFSALLGSRTAAALRAYIVGKPRAAVRCSELAAADLPARGATQPEVLEWLDLLSAAVRHSASGEPEPFLPLRAHVFHRTLPGIWACVKPDCSALPQALKDPRWGFGAVYLEERARCGCGAPLFPVLRCEECGNTMLSASYALTRQGIAKISPGAAVVDDEFELEIEGGEEEEIEGAAPPDTAVVGDWIEAVILPGSSGAGQHVDLETLQLSEHAAPGLTPIDLRVADDGVLVCDSCGAEHRAGRAIFHPLMLGAPFFLGQIIPTILEFAPDGPRPGDTPFRGRRALAFTDSRQGSARIAAKLQQDSERNSIRSRIVMRLREKAAAPGRSSNLESEIRRLEEAARQLPGTLDDLIATKRRELDGLNRPRAVSFADLRVALEATSEVRWMLQHYEARDPLFRGHADTLARLCIVRELARRPRRMNNLETMGLARVVYPQLDAINSGVSVAGYTIPPEDWRAFLKLCLDFFIRAFTVIDLSDQDRKWGGALMTARRVLSPRSQEQPSNRLRRWPRALSAGHLPRLARLLAAGLAVDVENAAGLDIVDEFLGRAWEALHASGVLRADGPAYYLPMEHLSFQLIDRVWVCPVTRRFLDTTFMGLTPYLPRLLTRRELAACAEVRMPECELLDVDWPTDRERLLAIRQWLREEPTIGELRAQGLWSDLNDRVLEGAGYFRTAEHSAQQPTEKLQRYEAEFRSYRLNLLSCSTTMEMGVDIGGVSTVAMNNVPPHPANYLQRAGRAGRRRETRALAVTLCKHNPHDYAVFAQPTWAFERATSVPAVSLSSGRIVQRHVSSLLLGFFLCNLTELQGVDVVRLTSGWFHGDGVACAPADEFVAWCGRVSLTREPRIHDALKVLLAHTRFSGEADRDRLALVCAEMLRAISREWRQRLHNIDAELAQLTGAAAREPACKALQRTRRRHTDEYLLKDLSQAGFLPAYGFPSGLVQFDNFTIDQLRLLQEERNAPEDNPVLHGDFATRDLSTALREYAPGSDVVIDGVVYRSAGVTLNWHAPASAAEVREDQYFAQAWRCRKCGAAGVAGAHERELICTECGADDDSITRQVFLQPAGFAVDFYEETHTDVTRQSFVPPEPPWIQAPGAWAPLPNPRLGRFRASDHGLVYLQSSGPSHAGYAICLACGRAEPMQRGSEGGVIPATMYGHRRLRGRSAQKQRECPGGDRTVSGLMKASVHLGCESITDVLELQLADESGRFIDDPSAAYTIAVAMRSAGAEMMGIEPEELSCEATTHRKPGGGASQVVVIFDRNAAGFTSALAERLQELLARTADKLLCARDCERACQHCLMSYDTRHRTQELDRKKALAVLSASWLGKLSLPREQQYLGPASQSEPRALEQALALQLQRPDAQGVRLLLSGAPETWDLASSPLRAFAHHWASSGREVTLVLPSAKLSALSEDIRGDLYSLSAHISIAARSAATALAGAELLAEVVAAGGTTAWASASAASAIPGPDWGRSDGEPLVRATIPESLAGELQRITREQLRPRALEEPRREIAIQDQLDGPVGDFGARFWGLLEQADREGLGPLLGGTGQLTHIEYQDRHLRSPLAVALLVSVLAALRQRLGARWDLKQIRIITSSIESHGHRGILLSDDWPDTHTRDAVLQQVLHPLARDPPAVVSSEAREVPRPRRLRLTLDEGTVSIGLDQGLDYWRVREPGPWQRGISSDDRFAHRAPPQAQAQRIMTLRAHVIGRSYKTVLSVTADRSA